jgi:hypothetical protein
MVAPPPAHTRVTARSLRSLADVTPHLKYTEFVENLYYFQPHDFTRLLFRKHHVFKWG